MVRLVLVLALLVAGCIMDGAVTERPACYANVDQLPGQPDESVLRMFWVQKIGHIPAQCAAPVMRWAIEADYDTFVEQDCGGKARYTDAGVEEHYLRACQFYCPDNLPVGAVSQVYEHDRDIVAHEWAHWMNDCARHDPDKQHQRADLWGPDGFVQAVASSDYF